MNYVRHPDYFELDQALAQADAGGGAAEAHGILCGLLCATGRLDEGQWAHALFADTDAPPEAVQQARTQMVSLAAWTVEAINDPVLGMDLVLPDPEQSLPERTAALGEWCQGFLLGLVSGGIAEDSQLPDDVFELIQDFTEISRAGFELDSASEEDEDAFAQITEYVRVGVLLINEELQPIKAPPRLQ